uniref:Uncharacterized protein n=1 Tax=Picea glauca TaxID=3330 RepID=A0A117NGA2_PICGL|nr:hypothetical protein ABT39_MTgene1609 [Picea glauca]QHR86550.1 hypothetical protein Q903MT_gene552 [Picea sitchensis]
MGLSTGLSPSSWLEEIPCPQKRKPSGPSMAAFWSSVLTYITYLVGVGCGQATSFLARCGQAGKPLTLSFITAYRR